MKKEKIIKIAKIIFQVIVGIILAGIAVVFLFSKLSGSPVFIFGKTTMWVITDSMTPTIPARSYILVEKITADEVKEGDIIAFYSTDPQIQGSINTHRVVEINNGVFVTKGDNNNVNDGAYSAKAENIVGRYVRTLPVMTFVGRIILSEIGFLVVVLLFLAVTVVCYMPDLKKMALKKDDDADEEKQREIDRLVQEEVKKLIETEKRMKEERTNEQEEQK